jgi:hypothetical protein
MLLAPKRTAGSPGVPLSVHCQRSRRLMSGPPRMPNAPVVESSIVVQTQGRERSNKLVIGSVAAFELQLGFRTAVDVG